MATSKPAAVRKSNTAKEVSGQSKDVVSWQKTNNQMVQNVRLFWLDNNIDDNSADCHEAIRQLHHAVNTINTYTNSDQCIEFLQTIQNEKTCMVISGAFGQHVVPQVHDMSQVDSIFIFCSNKKYHEQWTQEWPKIKSVCTDIALLCEALKKAVQRCEQNSMPISFMATSNDVCKKDLDQTELSFMYTQIMKEILLSIEFEKQHINEFIRYCLDVFAENEHEQNKVQKFEQEYRDKTAIGWYTFEYFLYPMLNRALRLMDVNMIMKMGFFMADLHRHIEQLHEDQYIGRNSNEGFTVYRGQGLSKTDFEQLSKTKGGLMSFNNFLSTTKSRNASFLVAESNQSNPDQIGILFVMTIDPSTSSVFCASINHMSSLHVEDEVLFSMHTVFRIGEITPMGGNNRLFQVKLTLISDSDTYYRTLTERTREETYPDSEGWYRLGLILLKMGQSEKAQQVYQTLLEQTMDESEKASIYNQLGCAKYNRGECAGAVKCYEKALRIYKKTLSPFDSTLAVCYNNIGMVYDEMRDYPKALSSYEKALTIRQQSLPPNHPALGMSYNNIGVVYDEMTDYPKALSSHEKALAIKQQSLSPNHPDLAASHNNIGTVYYSMNDYPKALSSFEKALEIQRQSLSSNHPDLASTYNNIGFAYENMKNYSEARSFYQLAVDIGQKSLSSNHPTLQNRIKNLERVKEKLS